MVEVCGINEILLKSGVETRQNEAKILGGAHQNGCSGQWLGCGGLGRSSLGAAMRESANPVEGGTYMRHGGMCAEADRERRGSVSSKDRSNSSMVCYILSSV